MNPLAQLNDIATPTEVSIWPLAWGWWVLAVLVVLTVTIAVISLIRYVRRHRARKRALSALAELSPGDSGNAQACNALLKRVAMVYARSQGVTSLHGEQWADFLMDTLKPSKQSETVKSQLGELALAHYIAEESTLDAKQIAEYWLSHVNVKRVQAYSNKEKALV
ncbi:DUF4381 domain-containing protein [Alteromonas sediminis]|uniref:DUF4381 domain-containing protein n=1 Tax=Alteromonas sediminis TaxID=2259342 RepID=A0A3N5ZB38_9ALTE|nr:DUF4381 domain-containing protein [Alteromonas sediminis]RPJ68454.1 DUF4381 domain-containing protein [Alteromonas sediminis]